MEKRKSKILKTVLRIALLAFVGVIVGVMIYNLNAKRVAGDRMPMPLGFGASVVLSGSMEPELSVGDLLIIKKTEKLYTGQVIVYQDRNSLIVHRIKNIDGESLITQGDANNAPDSPITKDAVKGEVVLAIPFAGYVFDVLRNPLFLIPLAALAIFLIERSYSKEKKEKKKELSEIEDEIKALINELKEEPSEDEKTTEDAPKEDEAQEK